MEIAAYSVPKRKNQLLFCGTEEGVRRAFEGAAGKVLLVADDVLFSPYACYPRAISILFEGDALPLFAMPDGVSHVLAAGGEETLKAARFFAEVRGIGCTVFPTDAALHGVFEERGSLPLGGEEIEVPLRRGDAVCDLARMKDSFAEAYAQILLIRLAKIETEALKAFGVSREYAGEFPTEYTAEELVTANARAREAEARGCYAGEGRVLASLLEGPAPSWKAYLLLSALYAAFFEKGRPRRYFTPDYRARAKRAGTLPSGVPSAEEYVARAMVLERVRAPLAKEALALSAEREKRYEAISALSSAALPARCDRLDILSKLPEYAPNGLSAIIRDFGLMEFGYDERGTAL